MSRQIAPSTSTSSSAGGGPRRRRLRDHRFRSAVRPQPRRRGTVEAVGPVRAGGV